MPKFSIITINLNNKDGLKKTIESVVNQTFHDYEYIVIDGASTDGSVDVIMEYDEKIDFWVSEPDTGIYNAMNKGIRKSAGDFLLFLNSGDRLYNQDVLKKADNFITPNDDIVAGNILLDYPKIKKVIKNPKEISPVYFLKKGLKHQSTFLNHNLFSKYGFYYESLTIASDLEFFIRALIINDVKYKFVDLNVTVFDIYGIGSVDEFIDIRLKERKIVFQSHFSNRMMETFERYNRVRYIADSKLFIKIYDALLNVYRKIYTFKNKLVKM